MALFRNKQWKLTTAEDSASLENWRTSIEYTISNDETLSVFLEGGTHANWSPKDEDVNRGFEDEANVTAVQRTRHLEQMLNFVAVWSGGIISRDAIVKESRSLEGVWNELREHFGIRVHGARWLDIEEIQLTSSHVVKGLRFYLFINLLGVLKIVHDENVWSKL